MKKKARRAGATETFSVSVDPETKRALRALADAEFQGNLSALGRVFKLPTEQLESISRQVPRKKRRNSGAYFEHFCGEAGVKAAEMRPSGV